MKKGYLRNVVNEAYVEPKKLQKFELIDDRGYEDPEIIEASSYQEALEKALKLLGKLVRPYDSRGL